MEIKFEDFIDLSYSCSAKKRNFSKLGRELFFRKLNFFPTEPNSGGKRLSDNDPIQILLFHLVQAD